MSKFIEYRVRQVVRHVITKYVREEDGASSEVVCELGNWEKAIDLAQKLAAADGGVYVYPNQDERGLDEVTATSGDAGCTEI